VVETVLRIEPVRLPRNSGQEYLLKGPERSVQRNYGVEVSKGELLDSGCGYGVN